MNRWLAEKGQVKQSCGLLSASRTCFPFGEYPLKTEIMTVCKISCSHLSAILFESNRLCKEDFLLRVQEVGFLSYLKDIQMCLNVKHGTTCLASDSCLGT